MNGSEDVDLDTPRKFFDPHPGFAGAAIPIPGPIKKAADDLAGRTLPLRVALAKLRAVGIGTIEVVADHGYIGLRLGGGGRYAEHFFRVIKYR